MNAILKFLCAARIVCYSIRLGPSSFIVWYARRPLVKRAVLGVEIKPKWKKKDIDNRCRWEKRVTRKPFGNRTDFATRLFRLLWSSSIADGACVSYSKILCVYIYIYTRVPWWWNIYEKEKRRVCSRNKSSWSINGKGASAAGRFPGGLLPVSPPRRGPSGAQSQRALSFSLSRSFKFSISSFSTRYYYIIIIIVIVVVACYLVVCVYMRRLRRRSTTGRAGPTGI